MSEFTKGKWTAEAVYGDHWVVFDFDNERTIADCFSCEDNARLIAAALEMYNELYEVLQLMKGKSNYEGDEFDSQAKSILELFNRIDEGTDNLNLNSI